MPTNPFNEHRKDRREARPERVRNTHHPDNPEGRRVTEGSKAERRRALEENKRKQHEQGRDVVDEYAPGEDAPREYTDHETDAMRRGFTETYDGRWVDSEGNYYDDQEDALPKRKGWLW